MSANDVWAVGYYFLNGSGDLTLIEHWDGSTWSLIPSPNINNSNYLNGVAAVSANDVWAVGNYYSGNQLYQTLIEHWDGTIWSVVSSPNMGTGGNNLQGVKAVSANNAWAVGSYYNGSIYQTLVERWDGTAWSVVPSPNVNRYPSYLYGVATVSVNDVWAVGSYDGRNAYQTLIEHWDGTAWAVIPSPNVGTDRNELYGVAAVSATDIWAVGDVSGQALVEHWNGTAWSVSPTPQMWVMYSPLKAVAAVSAYDVWAVGFYYNSSAHVEQTLVEHFNGIWSVVSSPNVGYDYHRVYGAAAVSASDVWAVGDHTAGPAPDATLALHYTSPCTTPTNTPTATPPAATNTPTPTNTPNPCAPVWSVVSSPNVGTDNNFLSSVAVVSANDVWAVGYHCTSDCVGDNVNTIIEHWNSTSWSVVSSPNPGNFHNALYGVAAVSANDVWAVGAYQNTPGPGQTLVEHWDGTSWSVVSSPNPGTVYNDLYGVAVVSANDVWAVGGYSNHTGPNQTLVEHWNGTSWSVVPSPNVGTSDNALYGVAAVSANDVWAVGFGGSVWQTLVEQWNGTSWSVVPNPNPSTIENQLDEVAVVSANDVWAVGYYAASDFTHQTLVEHWNGSSWSVIPSPNVGTSGNYLNGVAAVSANDVWAVGLSGVNQTLVEHWDGTSWSVVPSPNVNDNGTLGGVTAVSANDVWAVGNYGNGSTSQTLVEHYTSPCTTPTAIINGHLTWQDITQPDTTNTQVTGTLTLCNVPAPPTHAFTTDSSGNFTITTDLPDGAYQWYTKGGRHVSSSSPTDGAPLVISGGHATYEFGTQLGGDTNGDNLANASDFNTLKTQFNIANGQYSSDFDYNLRVNVLDFNMLKRNFNLAQHNLICP